MSNQRILIVSLVLVAAWANTCSARAVSHSHRKELPLSSDAAETHSEQHHINNSPEIPSLPPTFSSLHSKPATLTELFAHFMSQKDYSRALVFFHMNEIQRLLERTDYDDEESSSAEESMKRETPKPKRRTFFVGK